MFRLSTLKTALGVRFIVAATLPLLLFGWIIYHYLVDYQLNEAGSRLERQNRNIRNETTGFFEQVESNLLLTKEALERWQGVAPAEIEAFLQAAANQSRGFDAICRLDAGMHLQSAGLATRLAARRLNALNLDFAGMKLLPDRRGLPGAQGAAAVVWSDPCLSALDGKPVLLATVPMRDGYLLGVISLDHLTEILRRRATAAEDKAFAIIDRHGTPIAQTDRQSLPAHLDRQMDAGILSARTTEKDSVTWFDGDRHQIETALAIPQYGWVIHAFASREAALQGTERLLVILLSSLVIAAVLGGGLAFWQMQQLVRPLLTLRDSTQGVARGDYRGLGQLTDDSYAELNDLSTNFLEMGAAVMERETFLRASEGRYSSLINGMGEGLLTIDRHGKVADCNKIAEQIFDLSRQELIGQKVLPERWRIIHEDGTPFSPEDYPFNLTLRTGVDVNNQLMGLCLPDGREIWLQMNSRPQWSLHGDVNAAVVTFADVTRLKVAEASLRLGKLRYQELFQQFSALLEGITDRIYLLSPDLKIIWSNSTPAEEEGAGREAPKQDCCFTRHFQRPEPCPGCPVQRCFASGRRETGEIVDRQGLTWSLRAFPVKSEDVVTQVVLISEDITEAVEGERQRERASRLAALGELAAGVAHEINNPISGVINYAQLIANRAEEHSREHELAKRIIKEGDRIATIVRELLTFAREGSSEMQVVSVREALAEALSLCESQIRKEAIDLHVDLPHDLPKVESRNHQLQQLFLNLISNARHALAEKYPEPHANKILLVRGRRIELDGRPAIRLTVRDHGVGIAPELLERVMNPFVTTKPAGLGTGLGLSISFEIAKKHGGSLSIASEYGAWTEVTVDLPAFIQAAQLLQ